MAKARQGALGARKGADHDHAPLSPDAIVCAVQNAQNTLYGTIDKANSTQYIFLYNVPGANQTSPQLAQVIKRTNAHVGLVWSPDGGTFHH